MAAGKRTRPRFKSYRTTLGLHFGDHLAPHQGFSMFANKGWLTKEDGGGLDKPVLGVR